MSVLSIVLLPFKSKSLEAPSLEQCKGGVLHLHLVFLDDTHGRRFFPMAENEQVVCLYPG